MDVISWMCSSLRGKESRLYHYSEGLHGCGSKLLSLVGISFKNFLGSVFNVILNSNEADNISCMLDSMKWRYHGKDLINLAEL